MKLSSVLEYSSLPYNQTKECHLVLKLEAPAFEVTKRKPVNVITLVDVSSSMVGPKIDFTKKSMLKMVDNLQAGDRLGIITFNSHVQTLMPLTVISDEKKESLRTMIGKLYASGSTDIHAAIQEGYKMAQQVDGDARVILLTDGQPTSGVTQPGSIQELLSVLLKKSNHSLSTFGYGDDHDSKLLADLSGLGKGNYVYIKGPDEALSAFGRELGGLLSRYASNINIKILPTDGLEVLSVRSDLDVDAKDGITVKIADAYGEETKKVLLKVRIQPRDKFLPRAVSLGQVDVTFKKFDGTTVTENLNMLYEFSKNGPEKQEDEVLQQIDAISLLEGQKLAEEAARRGDFSTAKGVMQGLVFTSSAGAGFTNYANNTAALSYQNSGTYAATSHSNTAGMASLRSMRMSGASANMHGLSLNDVGAVENSIIGATMDAFTMDQSAGGTAQSQGASGVTVQSGQGGASSGLNIQQMGQVGGGFSGGQGSNTGSAILNGTHGILNLNNQGAVGSVNISADQPTVTNVVKGDNLSKKTSIDNGGW